MRLTRIRFSFLPVVFLLCFILILCSCPFADTADDFRSQLRECPNQILFETYRDNNWEIFRMNADGTGMVNLTNTKDAHEMFPKASPDGTKICFVSDEMVKGEKIRSVYYMNADGTGRTKVVDNGRESCWGADSQTIVYLGSKYVGFNVYDYVTKGIYFYDLHTKEHRPHPNPAIEHLYNPCVSSNGRWVVATVHGGMGFRHAIIALGADNDTVIDLQIHGCRPDLTADGRKITWGKSDTEICTGDIDLNSAAPAIINIATPIASPDLHTYHADWSPDGKYIAYSLGPGGKVQANGPGTNRGIAELVGVRAQWDIWIASATGDFPPIPLTTDGMSNKEPDWIIPQPKGGSAN